MITPTFALPPLVDGVDTPSSAGDRLRISGRLAVGFLRGLWFSTSVVSVVLLVLGVVLLPVVLVCSVWVVGSARTRVYSSADALLVVRATREGWQVSDHVARVPGRGHGRALRSSVLPTLIRAADTGGVKLIAEAATPKLIEAYVSEVPGLTPVRSSGLRGVRLERRPGGGPLRVPIPLEVDLAKATRTITSWIETVTALLIVVVATLSVFIVVATAKSAPADHLFRALVGSLLLLTNHVIAWRQMRQLGTAVMRYQVTEPDWRAATQGVRTVLWVWVGIAFLVLVRRVFPHLEGEIAGPSTELVGLLLIATTLTLMIGGRDAIRALDYLPPKAAVVPESGKRRSGRPSENPN